MTEEPIWIDNSVDANWISEAQRRKGIDPGAPTVVAQPTGATQALRRAVIERAYSPGQKRDSVGRFGSGGGGAAAAGSPSGEGAAGVGAGDPNEIVSTFASDGEDYGMKRGGVEREAQLRAWASEGKGPYTWEAVGVSEGVGDHALNAMQSALSMSPDSHEAVLIQSSAAAAGLGTGMVWGGEGGRDNQFEPSPTSTKLAQSQYDRTQQRLASGPEEYTLYRGTKRGTVAVNVLESWTTDPGVAKRFGTVHSAVVPRSAVFMDNRYGGGTQGEMEMVVLGSRISR